jgi:probable phosphoglycerate mutase
VTRASAPHPAPRGQAARESRGRAEARTQLILLRHGEPDWTPDGERTVDDAGLTAFGTEQARAAAAGIAREKIDAIYVSPLRRARETARPLGDATGIEPRVVEGLAEIRAGAGGGMTQTEVDRYFVTAMERPLERFWEGFPGGESFHDFHARVTRALGELLARHGVHPARGPEFTVWRAPEQRQTIVVVAHGGTHGVLLTHLLDVRPLPWEWIRFEMELAAYAIVNLRPVGDRGCLWSLVNFNEIDPLRSAGLR